MNINMFISPDIKKTTMDLIESKSNEISYWLNMRISEMKQLAGEIKEDDITKDNIEEYIMKLKEYQESNSDNYESFGLVTTNGLKYLTSGEVIEVGNREYFKKISEGSEEFIVSDPIISKANNKKIILIVMKLQNNSGQIKGYLSGAVSIDYLQQVVDGANIYNFPLKLYNRDTREILVSTIATDIEYEGEKKFTHFEAPIKDSLNWEIMMLVPNSFISRKLDVTGYIILSFGILILLTTIYILNKYVKSIVRPIENLKVQMSLVENGKLNPMEPDTKSKELNSLGNSYNAMIHNIETLINKLEYEERLKKEAEYKALYSQIKPHFLYNTLETIQAMAIEKDDEDVETAIGDLATLFRIGLSSDKTFINIEDELKHLESYVNIQLLRYKSKFTYTIDEGDIKRGSKFMKFTLQPLVENAIYHGIKLMEKPGFISVKIDISEDKYVIKVINSCENVDTEKINQVNYLLESRFEEENGGDGYGLYNVNQRLKLNFGKEYGVKLVNGENQVTAIVTHPILKEENR
ncbi:sensor histidine kinase [Clostridium culturomicium]|uniref:sensor histidine kinase n=1 Tax=Clostridium culturomicium TaxID=1499683 RepID=UPI0018CD5D37|nr:histidine kinase [Clostridium culturomicium]